MIGEGKAALVIDDDPDISELLTVMLEAKGFNVDVARDGIDAIDLKKTYDVILLDLNMPVFDGERLAEYWLMTQPGVLGRVIVLSGYSHFTHGRTLPTFATIQKPFEPDTLFSLIEQCLNVPHEAAEELP
jgi:DNA-binding response OmpR family regulator